MTRLAYILAASHSGSTLLAMLLGSHPQITTVGEMKLSACAMGDLDRYRCSCGEWIRHCGFWQRIEESMVRRGCEFDLAHAGTDHEMFDARCVQRLLRPMHRGKSLECIRDVALSLSPAWRRQLPDIQKRNGALASTIAQLTGAQLVVDSSKVGLRLKYLLRNSELEIKVIRLIRDGRAVALTYMDTPSFADAKDPAKRAGGMGGDRATRRLSMTQAAYEWRRYMEEAEHILRCMPREQWIEVHYEDYCRDPDAVLGRLHQFVRVEPGRQPEDFRAVQQHVVGNGMRLDTTSEIQLDERWRDALTHEDLKVFNVIAGAMNRRYGYQ